MSLLTELLILLMKFYNDATPTALGKSGGGPPHSKTLARGTERPANAQRPGVRQSPGALGEAGKLARHPTPPEIRSGREQFHKITVNIQHDSMCAQGFGSRIRQ
jgi:hypothetical protein